jgi:segregation and condensation protein B
VNPEEQRDSLADRAAAWVPPWQRPTAAPSETPRDADEPEDAYVADGVDVVEGGDPAAGAHEQSQAPDDDEPAEPEAAEPEDAEPEAAEPEEAEREEAERERAGFDSPEPERAESDAPEPEPAVAEAVEPESVEPESAEPEPAEPEPAEPEPAEPEPAEPQSAEAERVATESAEFELPEDDAVLVDDEPAMPRSTEPEPLFDADREPPSPAELGAAIEAILLVVDEPVTGEQLADVLGAPAADVTARLEALAAEYTESGRGFDLRRAAGGWRLYTREEFASYVERFVLDGQSARLTQASLETLAVIAYQQPVTRSRISAIRGVNCDGVVRTLVTRGLVEECGTQPESGAYLYRTTNLFLEKLGLDSVDELPPLAPFLPDNVDGLTDAER